MCFPCFSKNKTDNSIEEKFFEDGTVECYKDGLLHNEKGPAVYNIRNKKHKEWWFNGIRHREKGPAVMYSDGSKEFWFYGMRHRVGGPAIILKEISFNYVYFTLEWYFYGKLHRDNGPAIQRADGSQEFWRYGNRIK